MKFTNLFYFGAIAAAAVVPRDDNSDWDVTNRDGWSQPIYGEGCGADGCQFRIWVGGDKVEYGNWDPVVAWSWALDSKCTELHCDTDPFAITDMVTRVKDYWDYYDDQKCTISFESEHIDTQFILKQLRNVMRAALEKTKETWTQSVTRFPRLSGAGQMTPAVDSPAHDMVLYNGPSKIQIEFKGGDKGNDGTIKGEILIGSQKQNNLCSAFDGIASIIGLLASPWAAVPGVAVGLFCKADL